MFWIFVLLWKKTKKKGVRFGLSLMVLMLNCKNPFLQLSCRILPLVVQLFPCLLGFCSPPLVASSPQNSSHVKPLPVDLGWVVLRASDEF